MAKRSDRDVQAEITAQIVAELERGVRPWQQPWAGGGNPTVPVRANGVPYTGQNVIVLWLAAARKNYQSPTWMTYRQASGLGGQVRRGEKGTTAIQAIPIEKIERDAVSGEETLHRYMRVRPYQVFNTEQIDGLPERYIAALAAPGPLETRIKTAQAFFEATGADVSHGGSAAYYSTADDRIRLPALATFQSEEAYWATRAHETVHWSGAASRLARAEMLGRYGSEAYAMEELTAELGSAFLCAVIGITPNIRDDHAPYIGGWITVLKGDPHALGRAARAASEAASFLRGFSESVTMPVAMSERRPQPGPSAAPVQHVPESATAGERDQAVAARRALSQSAQPTLDGRGPIQFYRVEMHNAAVHYLALDISDPDAPIRVCSDPQRQPSWLETPFTRAETGGDVEEVADYIFRDFEGELPPWTSDHATTEAAIEAGQAAGADLPLPPAIQRISFCPDPFRGVVAAAPDFPDDD